MTLSARLASDAAIKAFALAGKATFTLVSKRSGARFTYRVVKGKPNPRYPEPKWFVKALQGSDYVYLGTIDAQGRWQHGGKSPIGPSATVSKAFGFFWTHPDHPDLEVWHEGQCGCCGKPLTTPESIAVGLGPVCAAKPVARRTRPAGKSGFFDPAWRMEKRLAGFRV